MAGRNYSVDHVVNKHMAFIHNPIVHRSVKIIPGIEETLGERLIEDGYLYAHQIYNQYLLLWKDKFLFQSWLEYKCGANARESADAYFALETWNNIHDQ